MGLDVKVICNTVICKKYMYLAIQIKYISYIYLCFIHSSWLRTSKIPGILGTIGAMGTFFVIMFGLFSSVPDDTSEP